MASLAVVGAGVVGVCTAYELARAGHQVILVDRNTGPAQGTSARNGAQLSYAYSDALASPSLLSHFPDILLGRDPAYRVRLQADPEFLLWGLRFLLNAGQGRFLDNTRYLLGLAAASQSTLTELLGRHQLQFDYAVAGKMILYATPEAFAGSRPGCELKAGLGYPLERLNRDEATAIEPALTAYRDPIAGVVYSPQDAVGQPHLFCEHLISVMQRQYELNLLLGQSVERIEAKPGRDVRMRLSTGETLVADAAVLCTGQTAGLAKGLVAPGTSWPVQGYSMTVPALGDAMQVSITDVKRKTVFARIGNHIRIAGIADIGSRNWTFEAERLESLRQSAYEAFGGCYDVGPDAPLEPWTGARPMTPSSRPIIRRDSRTGLYLNLAHGALGWTLALGSAAKVTELIADGIR
ncbi:FAD-dependent oxidoreductase [Devosia sp.]|uniref:FAD-dependent oxidoreductase n=1 Tax=Devosia sp. TaxID=1871048 RepID=UPI0019FB8A28|nr:FAD-dependent oxidoreductase [Devosia sp.]MBE0579545.1 FAD-dependent oxidoreductase [Devosia sp.]